MEPEAVKTIAEISEIQVNNGHYYIIVVASIVSFAVTQIVKPFVKSKFDKEKALSITRGCAVVTGGIIGFSLSFTFIDMWLGAAAGGMNAFIVKLLKKKAQSSLGVDSSASKGASKDASKDASKGGDK